MAESDTGAPAPKKRRRFTAARVVAIVLATPIMLVALAIGFLHTGPGKRMVLQRVFSRLEERVNGTATIGRLDYQLFGDLGLHDVVVKDADGETVVSLDSLEVTPVWKSLVGNDPVIDKIAVDGVTVRIVQYEDGTSNLKRLLKPRPPEPPPTEPPVVKHRHFGIRSLHVGTVNVELHKPDGTVMALRDFGLEATLDAIPTQKTAKVAVPRITAGLTIDKPQQGLSISVDELVTGVEIDVTDGAGTLKLAPTTATATIRQKGAPDRVVPVDLGGIALDVRPGEINLSLDTLVAGALTLDMLEVTGRIAESGLAGEQNVQLVGLKVDHNKLNALIGTPVLVSDVTLETKIAGPPEDVVVTTTIVTEGGRLELGGDVDVSDLGTPDFDVTLTGTKLETSKLLASDKVPPVLVEAFKLGLRGNGRSKEAADVDIGLSVSNVDVKNYRVDELRLDARFDGGELEIDPLVVAAYGTRLIARGKLDVARKLIDVSLTIEGDVGTTLARLRAAGLPIKTELPRGAIDLHEDMVTVRVKGDLEGMLDAQLVIDRLRVAGGAISGDLHASLWRNIEAGPDDKKVELRDLDGSIDLIGINLKQALAIRGKKLDGLTGTVSGRVVVEDVPHESKARYDLTVTTQPSDKINLDRHAPMLVVRAWGHADERDAWLNLRVNGHHEKEKDKILTAFAHAPLLISDDYKGVAPYRRMRVKLDMDERRVRDLLPYVPARLLVDKKTGQPRKIPDGTVFAHIDVGGTGAAPSGDIDLDLQVPVLGNKTQRVLIDGSVKTEHTKVSLDTGLTVWVDAKKTPAVQGNATATLSKSPLLPGDKGLSWTVDLDVLPQLIGELPLPPEKLAGLAGTASGGIHLRGNKSDATGTVDVKVDGLLARGKGPFNVGVGLKVEDDKVVVDVDAGAGKNVLVKLDGNVARGGKGLLAAVRDKTPNKSLVDKLGKPTIDFTLVLPEQSTSAYGALSPILYELPGMLGGKVVVSGDVQTPVAHGLIVYDRFDTLSQKPGRVAVGIDATPETLAVAVDLGPLGKGSRGPVAIDVKVPRDRALGYSAAKKCHSPDAAAPATEEPTPEKAPCPEDAKLAVVANIAADNVDIKDLIPGFALKNGEVDFDGRLTWKLDANIVLDPKPRYAPDGSTKIPVADESTLSGALKIHDGLFTIPGTKRKYRDILVSLSHNMKEVRIDSVHLGESDLEKPERKLDLRAHLALNDFKPGNLTAHLSARDWLVFGSDRVGPADAPRASLSTDIRVKGNLGKPIKSIDVDVQALELLIPDRFTRAHQPEVVSTGDVIYLKKGMTPGKLPVPLIALDTEAEDPFANEGPPGEGPPGKEAPAPAKPPEPESGLDVTVRIAKPAHILQDPMNLYTVGGLTIRRRGNNRAINGRLDMVDGDLSLGGRKHALVRGNIIFDDKCSGGCMDLLFARKELPAALRDISEASGGDTVNIQLAGPLDARVTTLSGAGSPGTLFDLLSMHNAGRPMFTSGPDLPATATTQFPQHFNLLMLSYFSVNVPHLLLLDRVAAWSDAYDGRGTSSYGEHRHYNAEGYYANDKLRVRGTMRPRRAGESEGELGFDYLFSNTPQTAIGVGITVGTKGGGGPGVFLEWSSKD